MASIFESKEFISLDNDEKVRLLNLSCSSFEERDLQAEKNILEEERQEKLTNLMKNKEALATLESKSEENSNLKARKVQVYQELEELKKQAGIYKQKQTELDKHKNALELKNSVLKKQTLQTEIQDLKKALEDLREQKLESQNSLIEIKANFDNFYDSYNQEMARLMFEESKLYECAETLEYTEQDTLNAFKAEQSLKDIKDSILVKQENIEKFTLKCQAVESELQERLEQFNNLEKTEEQAEIIVQAKDLESEILIYDNMMSKLDVLLDEIKQDISVAKNLYSNELSREREINENLEKINNSTAKVFENSELTNFEKLRNCDKSLADMRVVEYEVSMVDNQIQKIKDKIKIIFSETEELKNSISAAEYNLEQKEQVLRECKDILRARSEEKESLLGNNCLSLIIDYTIVGDSCPVCKSKVQEKNYLPKVDLASAEREIDMAKSRISYAEKDRNTALVELNKLKTILESHIDVLKQLGEEITHLEESKTNIYKKVIDVNDKTIENFGNIKNALEKTSIALEDLINLQWDLRNSVQENISKKTEHGSTISLLTEKYERILDLYYVLQKERAERELLLLDTVSFSVDFDAKRIEDLERKTKADLLAKEVIDLFIQVSELKTSILVEQEEMIELESKKAKLESSQRLLLKNNDNEHQNGITLEDIKTKMQELKQSYKHLLSLKTEAEESMNNLVREYEIKSRLLESKIDDVRDLEAVINSLVYRYGFNDEQEARMYITTDNMIKLKTSEINSYNARCARLETEYSVLDESGVSDISDNTNNQVLLRKQNDELNQRLGEINILINNLEKEIEEKELINSLLKKYQEIH